MRTCCHNLLEVKTRSRTVEVTTGPLETKVCGLGRQRTVPQILPPTPSNVSTNDSSSDIDTPLEYLANMRGQAGILGLYFMEKKSHYPTGRD